MLGEQRRSTDQHVVPVDDAADAAAGQVDEAGDRSSLGRIDGCGHGTGDRVLRGVLDRRRVRRAPGRGPRPAATSTSLTVIEPVVTVPVLSSTTVSIARVDSSASGPLIRMPSWAPRPVPTIKAIGVASPSAHGQAMISTATAAVKAAAGPAPIPSQNPRVATARAMTIGTKTPEMVSASRCACALPVCASSTSRAIWASWVWDPTWVARTTRRPPTLVVAPTTRSPGPTSTGTDSPVSIEASTAELPCSTMPSVAIASPGRTTNSSPTVSSSIPTRVSTPSRSTATSLAPSSSSARRAAPARRFDRSSM